MLSRRPFSLRKRLTRLCSRGSFSARRPARCHLAPPAWTVRPRAFYVARKPEPVAEGNGGWPFIFRRGPEEGPLCIAKQNKRPSAVLRFAPAALALPARCSPRPRLWQEPRHQGREGRPITSGGHHDQHDSDPRRRLRTRPPKLRDRPRHRRARNFTATSHLPASPIPAPCPIRTSSTAPSRTSSTSLPARFHGHPARNRPRRPPLVPDRSLPQKDPPACSASSTTTKTGRSAAPAGTGRLRNPLRRTRTPHRPGRRPLSSAAKPSSRSATSPPNATRPKPARPGVPARAASSTTST